MFVRTNIKEHYDTLLKLGISKEELYVVFLIYNATTSPEAKNVLKDMAEKFKGVMNNDIEIDVTNYKLPLLPQTIDKLLKKEVFLQCDPIKGIVKLNIQVLNKFFINPESAVDDLLNLLNNVILTITINNKTENFSCCNITDLKKFKIDYIDAIEQDTDEHKLVLLDLAFAKDNNLINVGLLKIVANKLWLQYRSLRLSKQDLTNNKKLANSF